MNEQKFIFSPKNVNGFMHKPTQAYLCTRGIKDFFSPIYWNKSITVVVRDVPFAPDTPSVEMNFIGTDRYRSIVDKYNKQTIFDDSVDNILEQLSRRWGITKCDPLYATVYHHKYTRFDRFIEWLWRY